jgi:hypothetical protein
MSFLDDLMGNSHSSATDIGFRTVVGRQVRELVRAAAKGGFARGRGRRRLSSEQLPSLVSSHPPPSYRALSSVAAPMRVAQRTTWPSSAGDPTMLPNDWSDLVI